MMDKVNQNWFGKSNVMKSTVDFSDETVATEEEIVNLIYNELNMTDRPDNHMTPNDHWNKPHTNLTSKELTDEMVKMDETYLPSPKLIYYLADRRYIQRHEFDMLLGWNYRLSFVYNNERHPLNDYEFGILTNIYNKIKLSIKGDK